MDLKQIDKGIRELKGIVENVNQRVQGLAVAIISHAKDHGDCSRALTLVNALPSTFRREFLIRFFRHFGSIGIDVKGQKVRLISADTKGYRGFDVDGAKANNWYEAADAAGNRADWYTGPAPAQFEPNTLGDFGQNIVNFSERLSKQLDATKEVGNKEMPVYRLSDEDRQRADNALAFLKQLGKDVMAREEHEETQRRADELRQRISGRTTLDIAAEAVETDNEETPAAAAAG